MKLIKLRAVTVFLLLLNFNHLALAKAPDNDDSNINLKESSYIYDDSYKNKKNRKIMKVISPKHKIVKFEQIYFNYETSQIRATDWGRITIDRKKLSRKFGKGPFYLNMFYPNGERGALWLIDNLYIPPAPANWRQHSTMIMRNIDLRPNEERNHDVVTAMDALLIISNISLPVSHEILDHALKISSSKIFEVNESVENAQGDLGENTNSTPINNDILAISEPPPPVYIPINPNPDFGFAAPIEVFQDAYPNIQTAINQCVPMAHANTVKYLENQFNHLPLMWDLPHATIRGIGRVESYDDILFWQAVPENSVIAQIDQKTKRNGVVDEDSGSGSDKCQAIRGLMAYLHQHNLNAEFSHQGGSDRYGFEGICDSAAATDLGELYSVREGDNPTWEWIFEQLTKGRGVSLSYGRYDTDGERTGGHMLRVWGASQNSDKRYLHLLDDGEQGSNNTGLRLLQYRVEDTGTPGEPGTPDGRLNIDGTSWEIEFAISIKVRPTLAGL